MDGNWVVNRTITFGPALIRSTREHLGTNAFIDCHLMITTAEETWDQYVDAGVDMVIAHIEAVADFARSVPGENAAFRVENLTLHHLKLIAQGQQALTRCRRHAITSTTATDSTPLCRMPSSSTSPIN